MNLCPHFVFIDNSFDFCFGSSKTFATSFDSFASLSLRNYLYQNIRHWLRHFLEWVYREQWAGLYVWILKRWHNLLTYSTCFPSFRHFRHRHRGKKVEPLLRVCGIAHCTWLSFETKHGGNFIVGRPTNNKRAPYLSEFQTCRSSKIWRRLEILAL